MRDLVLACVFLSVLFISLYYLGRNNDNKQIKTTEKQEVNTTEEGESFSDSVKTFIMSMNIKHPDIVFAQARLESNNFKSDLFLNNHNMFGMKESMVRNTVALGTKNGYAYYKNWQHSVIDYALYQSSYFFDANKKNYSRQEYLERLIHLKYAEDKKYLEKIIKIADENY